MEEIYARITGWGKYVPRKVLTNAELETMVNTTDEWITSRTGIKERHIAGDDELNSYMSVQSGKAAMKVAGIGPEDLDLIIVATSSPDYLIPQAGSQVQHMIGAKCGAFSLVAGCTGWVYALSVAQQFIKTGAYKTILVIGTELVSRHIDWTDRATCVLFGDASGAVVMQASTTPTGILSFELGSDGANGHHLIVPGGASANPMSYEVIDRRDNFVKMNGREVFKFASRVLGGSINRVLAQAGMSPDDIDLFIPHQANIRIVEAAARLMRVPMDRFYMNIQRYGNTSAASIPLALVEAIEEGRCKPGDTLALISFGSGLTWASAVVHLGGPDLTSAALKNEFGAFARARRFARRAVGALQTAAATGLMAVASRLKL